MRGAAHDTRCNMATVRPLSEKKIEANRRNARQSTGPKTDAGKHAMSDVDRGDPRPWRNT